MKLKAVARITLTLFFASMLTTTVDVVHTADEPRVHNIDTDLDYETIQDAIDAPETSEGHTIQVEAGIYSEHLIVDKSVKLLGEDISTTILDGSGTGTVINVTANNVLISGFTLRNSGHRFDDKGISLEHSSNTTISRNIITNNAQGIWLECAADNVISGNTLHSNTFSGIFLGDSNNNTISGNTVTSSEYGMWLERSSENNAISANTVADNWKGISLAKTANNNTISGNILTENEDGIHLFSSFNKIHENTMTNNSFGIFSLYSGGNIIHHNNFVENMIQVSFNESYVDIWDNGCEGNHWSDYEGQDLDGDGIGDTLLPHRGLDNYPLMEPWSRFRVFNIISEEEKYDVTIFSNSTIASFKFNSSLKQISFNVTGPSGAVGFCNVTIPRSLLRGPWLILVDNKNVTVSTVIVENGTHTFFYLSYGFSTRTVKIVGTEVFDESPPVADAGPNQTFDEDMLVTFDGSRSHDNVGITSYTWTFTDETQRTLTGVSPAYTFANPGAYNVTLKVTDGAGHCATDTVVITILDVTDPVADAGSDKTIVVNTEASFNANGSWDNVGIVTYEWDFGDETKGTGMTTTHMYTNPGSYAVTLTVKDAANNTSTDLTTVTVLSYFEGFRWWIVGAIVLVVIAAAGIFFHKHKITKNVT